MAYTGSGTQADPYLVGTIADLADAMGQANTVYIKMTADLDFAGRSMIQFRTPNANASRIYIDGDGTSWTNIALINAVLFWDTRIGNSGSSDVRIVRFSNITIEATEIKNNYNTLYANALYSGFFSQGRMLTYTFDNCIIFFKWYWMVFDLNSRNGDYSFYFGFGGNGDVLWTTTTKVMNKTNLVIDFYNIGIMGTMHIDAGYSYGTCDHYIVDSIIKISYYDENGWAYCSGEEGNFLNNITPRFSTWCTPLLGHPGGLNYDYKRATLVNSGVFVRYYADVNMNNKVCINLVGSMGIVNSYIVYECMRGLYIRPRMSNDHFQTYAFYDITKAPDLYQHENTYAYSAAQFAGLTTTQCKSRSSFEGAEAIIPFKLKQVTPGS